MLFEAFFWDTTASRPAFAEFRQHPEFSKLLSGWGRHGDRGVIAEAAATPLGAAWFRLWTTELHSYGFVDASTPELAPSGEPAEYFMILNLGCQAPKCRIGFHKAFHQAG